MRKKFIFIILIILFMCGCSFKYEVEIKDNMVNEKKSIILSKSSVINNDIYLTIDKMAGKYFPSADFLIGENTKEYYDNDDAIYEKLNNVSIEDYNNAEIFSYCYDAHNVIKEDNYILISTSNVFKCFDIYDELDNVDIILKTNHKSMENNADEVDGYIYKWHITKDNYKNKNIYIKLYQDKYVFNYENEFVKKALVIGGVLIFLTLIILVFVIKKKRASEI